MEINNKIHKINEKLFSKLNNTCWNCNVNVNTFSLYSTGSSTYALPSINDINDINKYNFNEFLETFSFTDNPQNEYIADIIRKKSYVFWICASCNKPNIHICSESKCLTIIPKESNLDFGNISDNDVKSLLKEFYTCFNLALYSSCLLLGRKIIMHIAVTNKDINSGEKKNFVEYIDAIEQSNILEKKWFPKIDLIRKLGNEENHEIKVANKKEALSIKTLLEGIINIYA